MRDRLRDVRPARSHTNCASRRRQGSKRKSTSPRFEIEFVDEQAVKRIGWLFSMVLGYSRLMWARFVLHQDLQSVLRCHIAAFEAIGGAPRTILYDRMKTAVIGEDADGLVIYNRALVDLARHYGFQPRACRPYRAKTIAGRAAVPEHIREDFFLGGVFRNLDDLNEQLRHWLDAVANPPCTRPPAGSSTRLSPRKRTSLKAPPAAPYRAVLRLERRASHEGMVSVGGNLYSVPDTTRRRVFDVHVLADEIRIFEDGALVATHAPLEGRGEKRLDPSHRKAGGPCRRSLRDEPLILTRAGDRVLRRSLDFYAHAVGRRLAGVGGVRLGAPSVARRVKTTLVALKMPQALEVLDVTLRGIERGEIGTVEAIDALLTEEPTTRETRRVGMAVQMARLSAIKTLAGFDFAFQPSLDGNRILALAGLQFIDRAEAVHLIRPPGTRQDHLSLALGVRGAVKAGRSVYFSSLADIVATLAKAERDGALRDRIRYYCRFALLIVDEIGYLPVTAGGGNLFFQLVNARYEGRDDPHFKPRLRQARATSSAIPSSRPRSSTSSFTTPSSSRSRVELSAARARRPVARDGPLQAARHRQSHSADPETPWPTAKNGGADHPHG